MLSQFRALTAAAIAIILIAIVLAVVSCATPTPQLVQIIAQPTQDPTPPPERGAAKVTIYEDRARDNVCYILYNSHVLGAPVAISCVKY